MKIELILFFIFIVICTSLLLYIKQYVEEKKRERTYNNKLQKELREKEKEKKEIENKKNLQEDLRKKEEEQRIYDIKIINDINNNFKNMNIPLIYERLNNRIANVKIPGLEKQVTTAETILLPTSEQYNFLSNQLNDIIHILKDTIINSNLPVDSPSRKRAKENDEISIESITNIWFSITNSLLNEFISGVPIPEIAKVLFQCNNSEEFFKPLIEFCLMNNIEVKLIREKFRYQWVIENGKTTSDMNNELIKEYVIIQKGDMGEKRVSEHIELYKDVLINMSNIRFESEFGSAEADNIVIHENGVFCIETKNYGKSGETIMVTKDGRWRRFKGNKEIDINNVSEQHNRHIGIMQRIINNELRNRGYDVPYVNFEPLYVIANDEINIDNQSEEIKILRVSSVYPYIRNFKNKNPLSKEIQEVIKNIILENKKEPKLYPVFDFRKSIKINTEFMIGYIEIRRLLLKLFEDYYEIVRDLYGISIKTMLNKNKQENYIKLNCNLDNDNTKYQNENDEPIEEFYRSILGEYYDDKSA